MVRQVGCLAVAMIVGVTAIVMSDPPDAGAQALPGGFVAEVVAFDSFNSVTAIDFLPDGRLLLTEKRGRVRMVSENDPSQSITVLNIQNQVNVPGDRGLLSMAVDPEFENTERIFVGYTYDPPETLDPSPYWDGNESTTRTLAYGGQDGHGQRPARVSSFRLDPATNYTTVVPGSEVVVIGAAGTWDSMGDPFSHQLDNQVPWACVTYQPGADFDEGDPIDDCIPQDGLSHAIGDIEFGPSGDLWASSGDAANYSDIDVRALRALDLDQLAGKLMRVDPDTGLGVSANPFYEGDGSSNRSRVWASGLRNPFRFGFDYTTGLPYVADTGWNLYEEVNEATSGASFGWPCFEGGLSPADIAAGVVEGPGVTGVQPGYGGLAECAPFAAVDQTAPYRTWCHGPVNFAVCGDHGNAALVGVHYPGGEYPSEYEGLWYGDIVKGWINVVDPADGSVTQVGDEFTVPVDMAIGPDGDVYLASRVVDTVVRIRYLGGSNQQPTAVATANVTSGYADLTVNFDATGSSDGDGTIVSYDWDFGDGTTDSGATVSHTYTTDGTFTATLTVTDDLAATNTDQVEISVGNYAPVPVITAPADGTMVDLNSVIQLEGSATDLEDGPLSDLQLSWEGILHHNDHIHEDEYTGTGSAPAPFLFGDHADETYVEFCLTATDYDGLDATTCIDVFPTEVDYTFVTDPPGLDIVYNAQTLTTPVTVRVPSGAQRSIDAPISQGPNDFVGWSIDGPASQTITTAFTDQTVVAEFSGPAGGPKPYLGHVSGVDGTWRTVTFPEEYLDPVVVATPRYLTSDVGAVTRVRNVTSTGFELKLQATAGATPTHNVEYLVVDAGVYTEAEHGITMEAGTIDAAITDRSGSWVGQLLTPTTSFTVPVVVGQVMSENDTDWSTFWARGTGNWAPPSAAAIRVGKHVGEDPDTTRANETVGYVIIDEGSWELGDATLVAGRTPGSVMGVDDDLPYSHPLGVDADHAVASQVSVRGGAGAWAVLHESTGGVGTTLDLMVDEDIAGDAERSHAGEVVDFVAAVEDPPVLSPGGSGVVEGDDGWTTVKVPLTLSHPSTRLVTVDFTTLDLTGNGLATQGVDFEPTSGVAAILPGETTTTVSVRVLGDALDEPPLLWGEWGLVSFSNPSPKATLDVSFFGIGVFAIIDDD